MYIAIVINVGLSFSPFNGIRIQAETWADELERQGHHVVRVNPWEKSWGGRSLTWCTSLAVTEPLTA